MKLDVVDVLGVVDALTADLRPPSGRKWEVIDCFAIHTDTNAQGLTWSYGRDAPGDRMSKGTITVAYPVRVPITCHVLLEGNSLSGRLFLNHDLFARITAGALGAGTRLRIRALVIESADDVAS